MYGQKLEITNKCRLANVQSCPDNSISTINTETLRHNSLLRKNTVAKKMAQ